MLSPDSLAFTMTKRDVKSGLLTQAHHPILYSMDFWDDIARAVIKKRGFFSPPYGVSDEERRVAAALWIHLGPTVFMALYCDDKEIASSIKNVNDLSTLQKLAIRQAKEENVDDKDAIIKDAKTIFRESCSIAEAEEKLLALFLLGTNIKTFHEELLKEGAIEDNSLVAFHNLGVSSDRAKILHSHVFPSIHEGNAIETLLERVERPENLNKALHGIESNINIYGERCATYVMEAVKRLYCYIPGPDKSSKKTMVRDVINFFDRNKMPTGLEAMVEFCKDMEESLDLRYLPAYHVSKCIGGHLYVALKYPEHVKTLYAHYYKDKLLQEASVNFTRALVYERVIIQLEVAKKDVEHNITYTKQQKEIITELHKINKGVRADIFLYFGSENADVRKAVICLLAARGLFLQARRYLDCREDDMKFIKECSASGLEYIQTYKQFVNSDHSTILFSMLCCSAMIVWVYTQDSWRRDNLFTMLPSLFALTTLLPYLKQTDNKHYQGEKHYQEEINSVLVENEDMKRIGDRMLQKGVEPKYLPYMSMNIGKTEWKSFEIVPATQDMEMVKPSLFAIHVDKVLLAGLLAIVICDTSKMASYYCSSSALQVLSENRALVTLAASVATLSYQLASNIGPLRCYERINQT